MTKASTERVCKNCGKDFIREVRAPQKYCDAKCRRAYWNKTLFDSGYYNDRHKEDPRPMMLRSAKSRAKRKMVPFDLEKEDIIIPEVCPVLNIRLMSNVGTGGAKRNSPALDRFDPELGYVKGNIQVISNAANLLKGDSTPDEMLLFADWILKTYGGSKIDEELA